MGRDGSSDPRGRGLCEGGGARRLGGARSGQVGEDRADDGRVLHRPIHNWPNRNATPTSTGAGTASW